jgi:hypothetical protein
MFAKLTSTKLTSMRALRHARPGLGPEPMFHVAPVHANDNHLVRPSSAGARGRPALSCRWRRGEAHEKAGRLRRPAGRARPRLSAPSTRPIHLTDDPTISQMEVCHDGFRGKVRSRGRGDARGRRGDRLPVRPFVDDERSGGPCASRVRLPALRWPLSESRGPAPCRVASHQGHQRCGLHAAESTI